MKQWVIKIFCVAFLGLQLIGCNSRMFAPSSSLPGQSYQAKEILLNNERYNKPYQLLGPVEYTLKKEPSFFGVDKVDMREQAIASLKQEALARYGDKVDAIIDFEVSENTVEPYGKVEITHVRGMAIAFLPKTRTYVKPRVKPKVVKKTKPAIKASIPQKPKAKGITIKPSEILK